jgi:hypothetical protein
MEQLGILYLFACWHVLMPGHGKSLLAAAYISGGSRTRVLPLAFAYSVSHGAMMALAAISGLAFGDAVGAWTSRNGLLVKNAYLPLLALMGVYFVWKSTRAASSRDAVSDEMSFAQRRPIRTGFAVGMIPCSDVLGLAAISPMLVTSRGNLLAAGLAVWLGVMTTVMVIALGLKLLPVSRLTHDIPGWLPCAAAALLCFTVLTYRGWILWRDYLFLY